MYINMEMLHFLSSLFLVEFLLLNCFFIIYFIGGISTQKSDRFWTIQPRHW